jgi:DNA-binding beta-propeller fold protein YncE
MVKQITGQKKSQGVAFATDLNRIFQGNGTDGVCNVFDATSFQVLHTLPLPDADNVRYNPATHLVYVGHAEKSITAFDGKTYYVKATIKLPGSPEAFQLDPERKRMYVNCLRPGTVAAIDLTKHEVLATYKLTLADANYPMAYDPATQRVFVGCRNKPMVVVLDGTTGKELAGVPIPADIDDLWFDAKRKRLYATCGEGVIAVLEEKDGSFEVVEKVPTRKLARTGLFDPTSDRLFVTFPKQGSNGPEIQVYKAQP